MLTWINGTQCVRTEPVKLPLHSISRRTPSLTLVNDRSVEVGSILEPSSISWKLSHELLITILQDFEGSGDYSPPITL